MDNITFKEIIKNIFYTKNFFASFLILISIISLASLIIIKLLIPSFKTQILSNTLDEARQVATHLSEQIDYKKASFQEIEELLLHDIKTFNILKVHVFEKNGNVLYSTQAKKIGTKNSHDYFYKKVIEKKEVFYKVETKGGKTLDGESIHLDIIEIYHPIIKNNQVHTVFELYYDISEELKKFNQLSGLITNIILFSCITITLLFFIILMNASKNNIKLQHSQDRLKELANTDSLTKLYNRRYFFELVEKLLNVSQRNQSANSLALIDIDNFKNINDSYGHACGDRVIQAVTQILKTTTRQSDVVARFGGEEFIVFFSNTNLNSAQMVAEKIRHNIEQHKVNFEDSTINVTISLGISECKSHEEIHKVIQRADHALYEAKKEGKNRTILN